MSRTWIVGFFADEHKTLDAVRALRDAGWKINDVHSPYPVAAMPKAMGLRHSWLGWATFLGAMGGAVGMMGMAVWASAWDWPINIGGRPMASIPAFFPPTFEAGVLAGALATVACLAFVTKLYPGKVPEIDLTGVNDDKFAIVLDPEQSKGAREAIGALLKAQGSIEVTERQEAAE